MTPIVKPKRPEAIAPVAYPEIQITETLTFDQILDKVVSNDKRPNKDWDIVKVITVCPLLGGMPQKFMQTFENSFDIYLMREFKKSERI